MPPIETIPDLPLRARRQLAFAARRPAWYRASYEETRLSETSRDELAGLPRNLEVPLVVLAAGSRQRPEWRSAELHARWVSLARQFQNDLASRSPRSRHIEVRGAGHFIHWDRPEVVIQEVKSLVEKLRRGAA
jgi:pimeloyl-ACP methyl ester carboxylesterase